MTAELILAALIVEHVNLQRGNPRLYISYPIFEVIREYKFNARSLSVLSGSVYESYHQGQKVYISEALFTYCDKLLGKHNLKYWEVIAKWRESLKKAKPLKPPKPSTQKELQRELELRKLQQWQESQG